jgi:tetratricopeptide (TPR) repeat protein
MHLPGKRPHTIANLSAAHLQDACAEARSSEEEGKYEEACAALSEYWLGPGHEPAVEGLPLLEQAPLLLRAGRLTSALGAARKLHGAQEAAKDLLSRAARIFDTEGDRDGLAEARTALALTYWREGSSNEAAALLDDVITQAQLLEPRAAIDAYLVRATVARTAGRYIDAAEYLSAAAPLLDCEPSPYVKGSFHSGRAVTQFYLAVATGLTEFLGRAESEYLAASFHFSEAGHDRYQIGTENNLALIYLMLGNLSAAHERLDAALHLLRAGHCPGYEAQVAETRARVHAAAAQWRESETEADTAVVALSTGDESALLSEALVTRGVARARLGKRAHARTDFDLAAQVASRVGDAAGAGRAHLALLEELLPQLKLVEAQAAYDEAECRLAGVQDASVATRLRAAAGKLLRATRERLLAGDSYSWEGFSLAACERDFRRLWIERAMHDANGVVSGAARLLGLAGHQTLFEMMKEYPSLRALQKNVQRRSVFGTSRNWAKRAARVAAPTTAACCKSTHKFFLRLALADDDNSLARLGPRGGDTLVAYSENIPEEGDLVVACAGGHRRYAFYWSRPGHSFRLTSDAAGKDLLKWEATEHQIEIYGPVLGYIRRGTRKITPLRNN